MNLKLPKTYKLLLAVCVVAGPFIWLVLTDDGKRRSDLFLLHLFGHQSFNIAHQGLRADVSERALLDQFARVGFSCEDRPSPFGDRDCSADIGSFNGVPARAAQLYWSAGELRVLRLDYRRHWHDLLIRELSQRHGAPRRDFARDKTVLAWPLEGGTLLMPETLTDDEEAALIWVAHPA